MFVLTDPPPVLTRYWVGVELRETTGNTDSWLVKGPNVFDLTL
jgi:hypothetical protein